VRVSFDGKSGFIQFYYSNLEQMDLLLSRLAPKQE
jgi:hypothetical protein